MIARSVSFICGLSIICLSLLISSSSLSAQNCSPWLDVKSWQATYTITGKGSGADMTGITWTINHQYSAVANLTNGPNGCSQILAWTGVPSSATGSGNDSGTSDCETIMATGTVAPPFPTLALVIDPVQKVYYVKDSASIPAQWVFGGCGHSTDNVGLALGPLASPAIPLPSGVDVLQKSNFIFTAPTVVPIGVPTTWTLSFKLTPSRPWVKVWMSGGGAGQAAVHHSSEIRAK